MPVRGKNSEVDKKAGVEKRLRDKRHLKNKHGTRLIFSCLVVRRENYCKTGKKKCEYTKEKIYIFISVAVKLKKT